MYRFSRFKIQPQFFCQSKTHLLVYLRLTPSQFYACVRLDRERVENAYCVCKSYEFAHIEFDDTNRFKQSLNWCQRMAKWWHNSACYYAIVPNIRLQSADCLPSIETATECQRYPQRQSSEKSAIWHFIIHSLKSLSLLEWQCFTRLAFWSCLNSWLEYFGVLLDSNLVLKVCVCMCVCVSGWGWMGGSVLSCRKFEDHVTH